MNKLLSVIIPVYNAEKYIERCLLSILLQKTFSDLFEIIVVNDGSNDSSCEIIKSIQNKYSNIRLFTQKNAGVSAARNFGISKAVGKYIQFLDADDYLEADSYSIIIDKIVKDDLELMFFKYRLCYEGYYKEGDYNNNFRNYNILITGDEVICKYGFHYSVCLCLINKDFLTKSAVLFTSEIWGEDILFITKLLLRCNKALILNSLVYNYVMYNPGSATSRIDYSHQLALAQSYMNVALELRQLVKIDSLKCSDEAMHFILKDSNLYAILSIIKLLKYDAPFEKIMSFYDILVEKEVVPIRELSIYSNFYIRISYRLLNYKYFLVFVCRFKLLLHSIKMRFGIS